MKLSQIYIIPELLKPYDVSILTNLHHLKHPNIPARFMINQTLGEEENFETQSLEFRS